jgi:hypothetical protein
VPRTAASILIVFFILNTKEVIWSHDARWLDKSYHNFFNSQEQLLSFGSKISIFDDEDDDEI